MIRYKLYVPNAGTEKQKKKCAKKKMKERTLSWCFDTTWLFFFFFRYAEGTRFGGQAELCKARFTQFTL